MRYFAFTIVSFISCLMYGQMHINLDSAYAVAMKHYRISDAITFAQQRLHTDSTNEGFVLDAVQAYLLSGNELKARQCLERALASDSTQSLLLFRLARLKESPENPLSAIGIYRKLFKADSSNAYFLKRAAQYASQVKFHWLARQWCEKAIQLQPEELSHFHIKAEIEMEMRAFAYADQTIAQAFAIDSLDHQNLFLAGKSAYLQQDHADAVYRFEKLFALGSSSILAVRYYGLSLYHLGQFEKSLSMMDTLIAALPDMDFPHYYRGLNLMALGDEKGAEEAMILAIRKVKKANLATYYEQLALLQQNGERHDEAIRNLQVAHRLEPSPTHLYHLSMSYDAWYADKSIALNTFEKYLTQGDSSNTMQWHYAIERSKELRKELHFTPGED